MQNDFAVIAFDDHADGQAYMTDFACTASLIEAFKAAFLFLKTHDHICILHNSVIKLCKSLTFTHVAPYSLTLEAGYGFLVEKFVNKL